MLFVIWCIAWLLVEYNAKNMHISLDGCSYSRYVLNVISHIIMSYPLYFMKPLMYRHQHMCSPRGSRNHLRIPTDSLAYNLVKNVSPQFGLAITSTVAEPYQVVLFKRPLSLARDDLWREKFEDNIVGKFCVKFVELRMDIWATV